MATRSDLHRRQPFRSIFNFGRRPGGPMEPQGRANAVADCGWGRVLFGQTFADPQQLLSEIRAEGSEQRDIAMYVTDPHVLLAAAPAELFLDPSHTFRLNLSTYRGADRRPSGFFVRRMVPDTDVDAVNRLYALHRMIPVRPDFFDRDSGDEGRLLTYFVAEDEDTGAVIGTVTGIDHRCAYDDPERGASLWTLAVDPQTPHPGVGEALIRWLAEHYIARGAGYMDLSVLHDNRGAIALYEKLGFHRLPVFAVKRRNVINERLFSGHDPAKAMNPYARIIVNEARRRRRSRLDRKRRARDRHRSRTLRPGAGRELPQGRRPPPGGDRL